MSGILGRKIGMTSVFDGDGNNVVCTVIDTGSCVVTQIKTEDTDGYTAVQMGFGDKKEIKRDYRKQLTHYVDLFGAGMVLYWYGFIEDILTDERIIVRDKRFVK